MSAPLTVSVQNVLIKDAANDVTPILWNPDPNDSTTQSQKLSAIFHAADKAKRHVKLTLYDSQQKPVKTFEEDDIVGQDPRTGSDATTINFTWDGTKDDGTQADAGVYLFQWNISSPTIPGDDKDTEKSSFETISTSGLYVQPQGDNGDTGQYAVTYTLTSPLGRSASKGNVTVYDPDLQVWQTYTMTSSDLTPGQHTVTVSVPSLSKGGVYCFLVNAWDKQNLDMSPDDPNYAAKCKDKGHRERCVLQKDQETKLTALNFDFNGYPGGPLAPKKTVPYADPAQPEADRLSGAKWQKKINYVVSRPFTNKNAQQALSLFMPLLAAQPGQVALVDYDNQPTLFSSFGHGGADSVFNYATFFMGNKPNVNDSWSLMIGSADLIPRLNDFMNTTFLPSFYNPVPAPAWAWNGTTRDVCLENIPQNMPFKRVKLAALIGCDTATRDVRATKISPAQMLVQEGATWALGFYDTIPAAIFDANGNPTTKGTEQWAERFWYYLCVYIDPATGKHYDINNAWLHALDQFGDDKKTLTAFSVFSRSKNGTIVQDLGKDKRIDQPKTPQN